MKAAFIVAGVRTPIGKYAGALSGCRADDLLALTISALLSRVPSLDQNAIDDVIAGCANQAGEDNRNVARFAALLAGLPESVPGITVNRLCASGMSAAVQASHSIGAGAGNIFIAGGVEQMSRAPFVMAKPEAPFQRQSELCDTTMGWRFINPNFRDRFGVDSMGETAEHVAKRFGITRDAQDAFALWSQTKTERARAAGEFAEELLKVVTKSGEFTADEFPRPATTLQTLASLKPAFLKDGTVTAGNSSGINDGACVLLIVSEPMLKQLNVTPLARIVADAVVGVEPKYMGIGPIPATQAVLKKAGWTMDQLDTIELNEAFAAQSLACTRELGLSDDDPRVNRKGGAISLGHPLGMSGARLLLTAARDLQMGQRRYGLCTMCVGIGQGAAVLLERAS